MKVDGHSIQHCVVFSTPPPKTWKTAMTLTLHFKVKFLVLVTLPYASISFIKSFDMDLNKIPTDTCAECEQGNRDFPRLSEEIRGLAIQRKSRFPAAADCLHNA